MEKIIGEIREKVNTLLQTRGRAVIAIDGSCAAGKSTLASALAEGYESNVLHMDDFFLRPEQRTRERLAEAGGNVDYERFLEEVLLPLKTGETFSYRPYDCGTGSLKPPVQVTPKPVTIVEGTYSHHPYFGDVYDLRIFLTVSPEVRRRRILERPVFLHRRFFEEWIPMEQRYFQTFAIEENCHISAMPADNR